jgi:hypothetical protein
MGIVKKGKYWVPASTSIRKRVEDEDQLAMFTNAIAGIRSFSADSFTYVKRKCLWSVQIQVQLGEIRV